jgi:hypothetical protein
VYPFAKVEEKMSDQPNLEAVITPEGREIRKIWHNGEWYFSIADVVSWATGRDYQAAKAYWRNFKKGLKKEDNLFSMTVKQFKAPAQNGKYYYADFSRCHEILILMRSTSLGVNSSRAQMIIHSPLSEFENILRSAKISLGLKRAGFVYVVRARNGLCKIGRAKNLFERIKQIEDVSPIPVILIAAFETEDYSELEISIHMKYAHKRHHGEWFKLTLEDIVNIRIFANNHPTTKNMETLQL